MALLGKQQPTNSGVAPTYNAVSASDTVANSGKTLLHVKNGSGASINVTLVGRAQLDGVTFPDKVIAVPAGQERMIGPVPSALYNDANGLVTVNFSATATVTMAVWEIP